MQLELLQEDGIHLAVTDGPLDESTHGPFRNELHPLFAERGVKLVVDLSGSKWVNSEGLAALVRLVTDANTRGARVIYAAPNPFTREVFHVTRLDSFFETAESREQALRTLSALELRSPT